MCNRYVTAEESRILRLAILASSEVIDEGELSDLLSNQELLGKEFEKVLYDNLWDLYVRF